MTCGRELDLHPGDRIRVTSPEKEPFPVGWAEGTVISAHFYDDGGWYVEMNKDNVSYGWQTGYGYFKEIEDEVTIEKLPAAESTVEPKYPIYIMEKVRQHLNLESWDTSRDEEINGMSHNSVLSHCLEWEGIIGYGYMITGMIQDIYGITLD